MNFKRFFIVFFIVLIVLGGLGAFGYFYLKSKDAENLNAKFIIPEKVSIGVPFSIDVEVNNGTGDVLNNIELELQVPEGVAFLGKDTKKYFLNKILGNLGSGSLISEHFDLIALSGENSVKQITAKISYEPKGLKSTFEKSFSQDIIVSDSGLNLDLIIPEKVFSGSDINFEIKYKNISPETIKSISIKMEYPKDFKYKSSNISPDFTSKNWDVGDLRSGSEGSLKVNGSFLGSQGSSSDIVTQIFADFSGESYLIAEKKSSIKLEAAPLSLSVSLSQNKEYAKLGDLLTYYLDYKNNTGVQLKDIIITAKISGEMFDVSTVSGNGNLNSQNNAVVWRASSVPGLSSLSPNENGRVDFSIKIKNAFNIKKINDKNFLLKVDAQVESPTVPQAVSASRTIGYGSLETKVLGNIVFDTAGYFRDASSGIINSGSLPLRQGLKTQFTIHWIIKNFANDARDVKIISRLGPNVTLKTSKTNVSGANVSYNERTGDVS
ncbi:MAG: hypothetical protein EXS49_01485, partial [Candidatus Pacebacteria bacterium]|nr:hypothetical protein [Candidatus Paceibacterota bacterium]